MPGKRKALEAVIPPETVARIIREIVAGTNTFFKKSAKESEDAADILASKLHSKYPAPALRKAQNVLDDLTDKGKNVIELYPQGKVLPYPTPSSILKEAQRLHFYDFPKGPFTKTVKTWKPPYRKGGVKKKPQMSHGGAYKGKKHTYAAGGAVKDMKIMRNK